MTLADKIRDYVPSIQKDAANGCESARQIINLYKMHCACPGDPAAPALCEAAFNEWKLAKTRGF